MRHFALLPVLVVCAFMCGPRETSADAMMFSGLQGRVIKVGYRDKTVTAKSKLDCIRSLCAGRLDNCAVSYNRQDGQCKSASVNTQLITLDPEKFTDIDSNCATCINKISSTAVNRPVILYLLDNVIRGTNLGSKGSQMNLIETGLSDWSAPGPRGVHSNLKYLMSGATNRAEIPYNISNESYRIDFRGFYTVAAWVKTDTSVVNIMPIIDGAPGYRISDFWFYSSKNHDELFIGPVYPDHYYTSPKNATGKQFWRHIAAVYKGIEDVHFYLNGTSFGHTINHAQIHVSSQPEKLRIGNMGDRFQFFGAMACVTIYERALSQTEVAALMATCP